MVRKPKQDSPDNFSVLFSKLMTGKDLDFKLSQFLSEHPGLVDLLIAVVRNRGQYTFKLLEEHVPKEFRGQGESSDILSQLLLVTFLEHSVKRWNLKPVPWMDQSTQKKGSRKSSQPKGASKKTGGQAAKKKRQAGDLPVSDRVVKILGSSKVKAIGRLKKAGSLAALAQELRDAGTPVTNVNLSYIFRSRWQVNAKEVLKGAMSVKRKASHKTSKRKTKKRKVKVAGMRKESVTSQVVAYLKNAATAKARLIKAGTVRALAEQMNQAGIKVSEANTSLILKMKFNLKPRKVLEKAQAGE